MLSSTMTTMATAMRGSWIKVLEVTATRERYHAADGRDRVQVNPACRLAELGRELSGDRELSDAVAQRIQCFARRSGPTEAAAESSPC